MERADDRGLRARGSHALDGAEVRATSAKTPRAAGSCASTCWNHPHATLLRRYREGDRGVDGYAEDYAYLVFGLLELFQADGDPAWLEWALTLQRGRTSCSGIRVDGGWFSTTGGGGAALSTYHVGTPQLVIVGDPQRRTRRRSSKCSGIATCPRPSSCRSRPRSRRGSSALLPWMRGMKKARRSSDSVSLSRLHVRVADDGARRLLSENLT